MLDGIRKNTNRKGDSIDTFMGHVAYQSAYYGHVHILVDNPSDPAINEMSKLQQEEEDIHPYCTIIPPTRLTDWSVDGNGKLNWVLIKNEEYVDSDPTIERETINTYQLIERDKWGVYDEDGGVLDGRSGTNEIGEVYLVTCYHKDTDDNLIGESLLKDIAYVNRILFNWCSCIDEMIERQTFSQLVVPDDGSLDDESESDDILRKIGTSSIWTFPADASQPPRFISPDTENLNTIWEMIIAHVREIHRLAGLTGVSEDLYTAQRSGKSQQYGFLNISTSLAAKSRNLQRAEEAINRFAYKWQGSEYDPDAGIVYPEKFDVEGLAQSMIDTFMIVERGISTRLNKEMLKKISLKALPLATQKVKSEIEAEIESGSGEIRMLDARGDEESNGEGEVGRPATKAGADKKTSLDSKETKRSLQSSRKTTKGTKV